MANERDCDRCGSPLPENASTCPICDPRTSERKALPAERGAGESARGIGDLELQTAKAALHTRPASEKRTDDRPTLDDLW